ncbi:hypothetical protein R3P38DRAFT_2799688 [Favolaschia claudopus]|uniref:Uncharacterized protein n=1 Tax=Favolaschia claudopus TaxID=2862362 RepID=A0AAW0A0I6_9AGAR
MTKAVVCATVEQASKLRSNLKLAEQNSSGARLELAHCQVIKSQRKGARERYREVQQKSMRERKCRGMERDSNEITTLQHIQMPKMRSLVVSGATSDTEICAMKNDKAEAAFVQRTDLDKAAQRPNKEHDRENGPQLQLAQRKLETINKAWKRDTHLQIRKKGRTNRHGSPATEDTNYSIAAQRRREEMTLLPETHGKFSNTVTHSGIQAEILHPKTHGKFGVQAAAAHSGACGRNRHCSTAAYRQKYCPTRRPTGNSAYRPQRPTAEHADEIGTAAQRHTGRNTAPEDPREIRRTAAYRQKYCTRRPTGNSAYRPQRPTAEHADEIGTAAQRHTGGIMLQRHGNSGVQVAAARNGACERNRHCSTAAYRRNNAAEARKFRRTGRSGPQRSMRTK